MNRYNINVKFIELFSVITITKCICGYIVHCSGRRTLFMPLPSLGQWYNWYKMIIDKSIQHVPQGEGKVYSKTYLCGYYNDLTNKFLGSNGATQALDEQGIPIHWLANWGMCLLSNGRGAI